MVVNVYFCKFVVLFILSFCFVFISASAGPCPTPVHVKQFLFPFLPFPSFPFLSFPFPFPFLSFVLSHCPVSPSSPPFQVVTFPCLSRLVHAGTRTKTPYERWHFLIQRMQSPLSYLPFPFGFPLLGANIAGLFSSRNP